MVEVSDLTVVMQIMDTVLDIMLVDFVLTLTFRATRTFNEISVVEASTTPKEGETKVQKIDG
jgi:hypothetical protein